MRVTGLGVTLGVGFGWLAGRRAETLLYGVSPDDARVIATVVPAVVVVSLFACGLPAWRAARVDPNETLRSN